MSLDDMPYTPSTAQLSAPSCPGFRVGSPWAYFRFLEVYRSPEVRLDWMELQAKTLLDRGGRMCRIARPISAPADVAALLRSIGLEPAGAIPTASPTDVD